VAVKSMSTELDRLKIERGIIASKKSEAQYAYI